MSEFYGPSNDEESLQVINLALDKGCNLLDTADMYGSGKNEELLAKVLQHRRSDVFLATKFGYKRGADGSFAGLSGDPDYVKQACDDSLRRLGVSQIDLYYQHRVDPATPIEETVKAMAQLVHEGKVRFLGLSECSAASLRKAHAVHPIAACQVEYSPWTLDIERNDLLKTCRELGVAVVAYSPLGRGFLTGKYKSAADFDPTDFRKYGSDRFSEANFVKNLEVVKPFEEIAAKKGCSAATVCLAWVLAQGDDIIPIPGTRRPKYLLENLAAMDVQLDEGDLKKVRDVLAAVPVAGERYHPDILSTCNA